MVENSICIRCGTEGPVNADGLCLDCEERERTSGFCCRICGRECPTNQDGVCEDCAPQQNFGN